MEINPLQPLRTIIPYFGNIDRRQPAANLSARDQRAPNGIGVPTPATVTVLGAHH